MRILCKVTHRELLVAAIAWMTWDTIINLGDEVRHTMCAVLVGSETYRETGKGSIPVEVLYPTSQL